MLSVVALIVPLLTPEPVERVNTTVSPPLVRLFPTESLACSRNVSLPPEAIEPAETDTIDWAVTAFPGMTVTVGGVEVTGLPPIAA